jgi:hypothetical protein
MKKVKSIEQASDLLITRREAGQLLLSRDVNKPGRKSLKQRDATFITLFLLVIATEFLNLHNL